MAQRTDLYYILLSFAKKNNSPYIEIENFLEYLGQKAKRLSAEHREWQKWDESRNVKFWAELSLLAEEGKCILLSDTPDGSIFMPQFSIEILKNAYEEPDANSDNPFPDEKYLRIELPENQIRPLATEHDFPSYLEEPQKTDVPIIKLYFPDGFDGALILASMIPRQLAEMAMLKLRNYLRKGGNKEFYFRKLSPQLQGRDSFIENQFTQIFFRPSECFNSIEEGKELPYLFWAHFSILVKNDIKRKKEKLSQDIAVFQSICIIEALNSYYKTVAVKRREKELAFKHLEDRLGKPPFLYTIDEVFKFTNPKGVLLLGQYTKNDLEKWLKTKTTETEGNQLPVLFIMHGTNNERFFLLKSKMLALTIRLLAKHRIQVRENITKYWSKLLLNYLREPAMDNDDEFEHTLALYARRVCPDLSNLLEDSRLYLVYRETIEKEQNHIQWAGLFSKGQMLPYSAIFLVTRKDILSDAKFYLPFWHSMPLIGAIIAFFKILLKKKKNRQAAAGVEEESPEELERSAAIKAAASDLIYSLVPKGHNIDSYMKELETRWSRLLDKKARENLIEDVQSLLRDKLRQSLKVQRAFKLTGEAIHEMAVNIISSNNSLSSLNARDSLILYSELYLLKLLENTK